MLVMGLDTALQRCSVALVLDGQPIFSSALEMELGHAERLAPLVNHAFEEADIAPTEIDRIGVVVGPGGFTGVRVALSFARAFALGVAAECVGVTSLAALADPLPGDAFAAPLIDARRGQVYGAVFKGQHVISVPFVAAPDEAAALIAGAVGDAPVRLVGSGGALVDLRRGWSVIAGCDQIDPVIVARLAAMAPAPQGPPAPLYLRGPDAKPASRANGAAP